ncbi:hypothetical protein D3C71_1888990 [compost metagenome]
MAGVLARLCVPTALVSCSCATVGTWITKRPLRSTSARVRVLLSSTTVSLGGAKSSAQAQAAAMTLSTPPWRAETSTVGPWLMRRCDFGRGTAAICGFMEVPYQKQVCWLMRWPTA